MRILTLVAAGVACVGVASAATAQDYVRITDEDEFREEVVDRAIVLSENGSELIITAQGGFDGSIGDDEPVGTWSWEDDRFCRALVIGSRSFPRDCQEVYVAGDSVYFIRGDGSQAGPWPLR